MEDNLVEQYSTIVVNPRFCYLTPRNGIHSDMEEEISFSLTRNQRFIHPKFLYDKQGSALFDEICTLPEYYLTRSEMEILNSIGTELSQFIMEDHVLVELGSGSAKKTRKLLELLAERQKVVEYYPVDISDVLKASSINLQRDYHNVKITGILDKYESALDFIKSLDQKKIIVFLGSSLGNFDGKGAAKFLKRVHDAMNPGDHFLLGVDLVKDRKILENAYNDFKGVTAKFNLNLLSRINRDLGGNFDLKKFEHLSFYNTKKHRIEMHLRSRYNQMITISKTNTVLRLQRGETILTEYSYKYTIPQIERITSKIGFQIEKIWLDKNKFFALILFS